MKTLKNGIAIITCLMMCLGVAVAQDRGGKPDPFQGKLFAPDIILKNQDQLNLTKEQFTGIKAAVVEVQANVAEHEWDLREAYQKVLAALDDKPIDEKKVLENVNDALLAENQVKKQQVAMLIRLRNLLDDEQVAYLQSLGKD
jgi:Spy/CpxP family protein refolding chaperone